MKQCLFTATKRHRVWAEIDLDHLIHNFKQAQQRAGRRQLLCVIKADAYGHGAVQVARALLSAGANYFAVNTPEEAMQLRRHHIMQPILILGMVSPDWVHELSEKNITLTVGDSETARLYAKALGSRSLRIHLKLETGINRIGFQLPWAIEEIEAIASQPCFQIEGAFSHFSAADDADEDAFTQQQQKVFQEILGELERHGIRIPLRHIANSAAISAHPDSYADMIRPGLLLYGYNPGRNAHMDLRPVLSLRSHVVQTKTIRAGESVGYGRTWKAPRDTKVATLGIGYADGLFRLLSGKIDMLLHGHRVPQIGLIGMDMCMLDVSSVADVKAGDIVTIIGRDASAFISADELAAAAQTISYEILCAVGRRVPRLYTREGKITDEISYVDRL